MKTQRSGSRGGCSRALVLRMLAVAAQSIPDAQSSAESTENKTVSQNAMTARLEKCYHCIPDFIIKARNIAIRRVVNTIKLCLLPLFRELQRVTSGFSHKRQQPACVTILLPSGDKEEQQANIRTEVVYLPNV